MFLQSATARVGAGLLVVLTLLTACDNKDLTGPGEVSFVAMGPDWAASLAVLARGVKDAMSAEEVRKEVLKEMRGSPFVEHKLVLQDAIRTHRLPQLTRGLAAALDIRDNELHRLLDGLPLLDFYVPLSSDRSTWRGEPEVDVVWSFKSDGPMYSVGFGVKSTSRLRSAQHARTGALIALHPAEHKGFRIRPQASTEGEVIQDPDDGQVGITWVTRSPDGEVVSEFDVGSFMLRWDGDPIDGDCDPIVAPEYCGDPGTSQATSLVEVILYYDDGVGSAEVEWTLSDETHTAGSTVRMTGLESGVPYVGQGEFWPGGLEQWDNSIPNLYVIETDAFSDDNWGEGSYTTSDRESWQMTMGLCADVGDPNTAVSPWCASGGTLTPTTEIRIDW